MIKGISLFSNVGIAETYLSEVGVDIVIANELLEERARFYKHLYPKCDVVQGDITDEKIFEELVRKGKNKKIEFLMATPPCQGMSIAGEMNPYDERNSLIKYAVDLIDILMPKYVLLENVTQQLVTPIQYNNSEVLIPDYIKIRLGNKYNINKNQIINSMDYGVPQQRKRAIFLMIRKDLNKVPSFPKKEEHIITLAEAFEGIPDLWPIVKDNKDFFPKNSPEALSFHPYHKPPKHIWRNVECMLYTPTGNTAFDNKYYYPKKVTGEKIKGYDTTYHRMFWDKPSSTITKYNGIIGSQNNVHPGKPWKKDKNGEMMYTNPRVLTIYELLIVSSLPTDWNIPGWASETLIRHVIGEGIPPLLVKKIVKYMIGDEDNDNKAK